SKRKLLAQNQSQGRGCYECFRCYFFTGTLGAVEKYEHGKPWRMRNFLPYQTSTSAPGHELHEGALHVLDGPLLYFYAPIVLFDTNATDLAGEGYVIVVILMSYIFLGMGILAFL
ncbi:unnamed protein product, partial [Sphacelaria rigidula]